MAEDRVQRRLAAILAADVVGYSRLMGQDEVGTLVALKARRKDVLEPLIAHHRGRLFKVTGDGALIEFGSAVNAVQCAIALQEAMANANAGLPNDRHIVLRIGINLGDVMAEGSDLYGDGVNIAVRLEAIAEPGGIWISDDAHRHVRDKVGVIFQDIGEHNLKNIAQPVRVYRLRLGDEASPVRPSLALPDKPSIAVLPFQNLSDDPEQEFFSDGITEDIITALSKLRWFFVIARNSTFAYKGKAPDIRQVARDLGVRYVLEGSVRRSGDRLRISSQLVDATTGAHVWAERYDRAVSDIFAVQDEIAENVAGSIESQVFTAESLRAQNKPPESLDAWGCVIRAMPYVWTWAAHDTEIGLTLLKRAVEIDPNYARASSLLAWGYAARAHLGRADPTPELGTALGIARRAIELDWEDPWAHLAMGYVHMVSRRSELAIAELNEAIELNPSFAFAHMILGSAYGYAGLAEEGLHQLSLATRLSPRDHLQAATLSTTGLCHLMAKRFVEAAVLERRAVQLRPHFGTAWRTLAAAAGLAGDTDLGAHALSEAKRLQPNLSVDWVEKYHPIVRGEDRAMYIDGLRKAGLQ
jgi:adenylate cyclase